MLAETKRTSLSRLAKTVQGDHQALHHVLANTDWSLEELRCARRAPAPFRSALPSIYKPKTCLKPGDIFQTKPPLAFDLVQ